LKNFDFSNIFTIALDNFFDQKLDAGKNMWVNISDLRKKISSPILEEIFKDFTRM